jgi:UDP-N-acetyl-D-glucosamine dehydrogenase
VSFLPATRPRPPRSSRTPSAPSTSRSSTSGRWSPSHGDDPWEVIDGRRPSRSASCASRPAPAWAATASPSTLLPHLEGTGVRPADGFIEMAGEINSSMPYYVCQRLLEALSQRGRGIRDGRRCWWSPGLQEERGRRPREPELQAHPDPEPLGRPVDYHDPYVPVIKATRHYPDSPAAPASGSTAPLSTSGADRHHHHDSIDWAALLQAAARSSWTPARLTAPPTSASSPA